MKTDAQMKALVYRSGHTTEWGIAPWWMFDWNEWTAESVSMTVKVPEAGLLAIRGKTSAGFGDMHDWSGWEISGVGVSEDLPRPDCSEAGAALKVRCSGATTVTLKETSDDDKFTMSDMAFYPASSKSVHVVGDFVVSRRVENAYGGVSYPLYFNGYVTGGTRTPAGHPLRGRPAVGECLSRSSFASAPL